MAGAEVEDPAGAATAVVAVPAGCGGEEEGLDVVEGELAERETAVRRDALVERRLRRAEGRPVPGAAGEAPDGAGAGPATLPVRSNTAVVLDTDSVFHGVDRVEVVDRQPFGGFGLSGVGSKAGGPDYLLQFLDPRVVTENTLRQGFAPS